MVIEQETALPRTLRNFRTESGTVLPEAHIPLAARPDQPYTQQSPQ